MRATWILLVVLGLSRSAAPASAQTPAAAVRAALDGQPAPELPATPDAWLNTPPLTVERLSGKGAVLLFLFPQADQPWGNWKNTADGAKNDPVVFIVVISGAPRAAAQAYAAKERVSWPILVDSVRTVERAYGVGVIGPNNLRQVMKILPIGKVSLPSGTVINLSGAHGALMGAGAKWVCPPEGIPEPLRAAWHSIEFGYALAAAEPLKAAAKSSSPELKQGAAVLQAAAQRLIEAQVEKARTLAGAGRKYDAYTTYVQLSERFKGFDLPPEAETSRKELAAAPETRLGIAAVKQMENAKRLIAAGNSQSASVILKKVSVDMDQNSLGQEARELLAKLGVP